MVDWSPGTRDVMVQTDGGSTSGVPADNCYCQREGFDVSAARPNAVPWPRGASVAVVFGSRSLQHEGTPSALADRIARQFRAADVAPDAIISGGADGIDAAGEAYAIQHDLPLLVCSVDEPSDSTVFRCQDLADSPTQIETVTSYNDPEPHGGAAAYLARNCVMAELADTALAVWDGDSRGTQHMLVSCASHEIPGPIVHQP